MKSYDVVALGELLIDFTESGWSPQHHPLLEANPGGAPCNVLAMLSRLGRKTALISKVGEDAFGDQLRDAAVSAGVDVSGLCRSREVPTTLAFVHTRPDGDREFSFYRHPGADCTLSPEELDDTLLTSCRIFHYGTLSMTAEPCRSATLTAIDRAKRAGAMLSFDPNLRPPLWHSLDEARRWVDYGLSQCDIAKLADDELTWFTGCEDMEEAVRQIRSRYPNIQLLLATFGRDGSRAYAGDVSAFRPAVQVHTVETTGAGDTFCACVLNQVLNHGLTAWTQAELEAMLDFSNAAAALITTRKGALSVMPTRAEVEALMVQESR